MAIGNPVTLTSNVASKTISVTATASQTLFTVTGGYRINQLAVYRNGIRLVDGTDYTARDGASVTLLSAATEGDTLEFQVFDDFRVADAIVSDSSNQTIRGNLTVTGTLTAAGGGSLTVGIQSGGTSVGSATTLNFIGSGNTFRDNGNGIVDISISGGGGGGVGEAVGDADGLFSWVGIAATVTSNIVLDTSNAGPESSYIITTQPTITIANGVGVTVGSGKTWITDVLNLSGL